MNNTSWLAGILPARLFSTVRGRIQYERIKPDSDQPGDEQVEPVQGSPSVNSHPGHAHCRPRTLPVILAMLPLVLLLYYFATASATGRTVHLDYTSYSGVPSSSDVTVWRGMRYAAPPTGSLRFAAPEDPTAASGVHAARKGEPQLSRDSSVLC